MIREADFDVTVDPCIDAEDTFVWSLLVDGGVFRDGYSGSEREARIDAHKAMREEIKRLNSGDS